jgi:hypothetical protein
MLFSRKHSFFAKIKDPALQKATQLAIVLHQKPSEILALKGSKTWLLEVDYQLIMEALEKASTGEEETKEEKIRRMKEWRRQKSQ